MGERKGQNLYYPPDFDPKKHRNLNAYHGTHALRERAAKIDQGIIIIRFEMPYNIWCDGCQNPIGMGVRYNAEKTKVGMYYTTPLYRFKMRCHLCPTYFVIDTDPKNHDYVIVSGARRKEQRWDAKDNEQIRPEDRDTQKKLATDAMFKLEHGRLDLHTKQKRLPALADLVDEQTVKRDDYDLNRLARKQFREEKLELKRAIEKDKTVLMKGSLSIPLLPEKPEDARLASLLKYSSSESMEETREKTRREISRRPLFTDADSTGSVTASEKDKFLSRVSRHPTSTRSTKRRTTKLDKLVLKSPKLTNSVAVVTDAASTTNGQTPNNNPQILLADYSSSGSDS